MEYVLVVAGLVILLVGGEILVRGAVALSLKLGISALLVSLTIVAFGTSAPELIIALNAALDDVTELALGNVVGSNIANVLLVLGTPALIYTICVKECASKSDFWFMMIVTAIFIALCFFGPLQLWHGLVLLALVGVFLYRAYAQAQAAREDTASELEEEFGGADTPVWKIAAFLILGMIALPFGAELLVDNAIEIAEQFDVPEEIIGLTIIAIGTSLPELATTVMAARQKEAGVAIGNVIGSNIFNLAAIIGITALVEPLIVPAIFLRVDLWIMAAASLLLLPFATGKLNLSRPVGIAFLLAYGLYLTFLIS